MSKFRLTLFLTCLSFPFLPQALAAATQYGNTVVTEVRTIYDGDTFKVDIDGWPDVIGQSIGIRVNGVDTPEMRGKCDYEKALAREAKKHTASFLRNASKVELRNMQRGKYFRIVADVYANGKSLSESLLKAGLAKPYDGGKKSSWCK